MKKLPLNFTEAGFEYQQVSRDGDFAIYRRKHKDVSEPHFEVIRVKSHNGFVIAGKTIEPSEMYPSASQWGAAGWTLPTLDAAVAKLGNLIAA